MAMVTIISAPPDSSIQKALNIKNDSNFRDASFSSYLNEAEEELVLKLAESSRKLTKKSDDEEIDIFSAEKYFNEEIDDANRANATNVVSKHQHKLDEPNDIPCLKQKNRPKTPSIRSESSWNSRSALLHNIPRNQHQKPAKPNKAYYGKKLLASLGCKCSCNDKNSVEVDQNTLNKSHNNGMFHSKAKHNPIKSTLSSVQNSESGVNQDVHYNKTDDMGIGSKSNERFSFPMFHTKAGDQGLKIQLQEEEADDTKRKSLEVFGSPRTENKGGRKLSLEKRLGMLTTWDAIAPKPEEQEIDIINIASTSPNEMYEDGCYPESDASSDLFEIESFPSNNTNNPSYLARQTSDGGMSSTTCVTPITCYAPSEASIEWSVVTASAADFSLMSDSEEFKTSSNKTISHRVVHKGKDTNKSGNEKSKRRSSILLGCKSQKAVGVVGDVLKSRERTSMEIQPKSIKTEPFMPMTRFGAESCEIKGRYDAGKRKHDLDFTTRIYSTSYAGRSATDLLYI